MLATVIATLCLNGLCVDKTVTTQATMAECLLGKSIPGWMETEGYTARGYTLTKWSCDIGGRRRVPT